MQNFTVSEHEKLNTAVALGFFDGHHKGHRRVILSAVVKQWKATKLSADAKSGIF